MGGRIISMDMDKASGSRWDPKASSFASTLQQWYMPLVPIFRDLRDATVSYSRKLHCLSPIVLTANHRKSMASNCPKLACAGCNITASLLLMTVYFLVRLVLHSSRKP